MTQHRLTNRGLRGWRSISFRLLTSLLLFSIAAFATGCASRGPDSAGRDAALRQIAAEYAATDDLKQAQAALDKLNLANPGQLLVSVAESDLSAGRSREDVEASAHLAEMLGARSQKVAAYLTPSPIPAPGQDATVPTASVATASAAPAAPTVLAATIDAPTAVPLSPTVAPPTTAPTATVVPPSPTPEPQPTNSPTPEPQNPRVVAGNTVNLRGGPGREYPIVARLAGGQEAPIIGRNASGDWWQLQVAGVKQAWVAGTVIRVLGAIDTVEVAKNIPPAPTAAPMPTAAPQPPAAAQPPTAPPVAAAPGRQFAVQTARLRAIGEGSQACHGGDHNIFVTVLDAGGAPVDGVRVLEVWTQQVHVTGDKGPGRAEFDLYRDGGGQIQLVDGANNPISDLTRGLSNTFPDFDMMKAAGYCNCKPHPDDASCESDIVNKQYLFAWGHYAYEVVFRRTS